MRCPVQAAAQRTPARTAVIVDDGADVVAVSYGDLDARAAVFAAGLRARGLRGRRVALRAGPSLDVVALHVAAARAGVTLAPLHLRLRAEQQDALAAAIGAVVVDDLAALAADAEAHAADDAAHVDGGVDIDDDHETLLFTSGTTGPSKAARITMHNLVVHARAACAVVDASEDDVWLLCLPLFHIGGIAMLWRALLTGATLRLQPAVDVDVIAARFADGSVQHASLVPTTLAALLPKLSTVSPRLKAVLIGGGPVPEHLLVAARARGLPAVWTWGMTETTSQAATATPAEPPQARARPLPGVVVRVVDDDHVDVAPGVVGNVLVRGEAVFRGYLGDDGRGDDRPGGFFVTGDLGSLDVDGRLAIVSRRTDLILSGGENLYPVQIEEALSRCPHVADVGVGAVDDEKWGQRPHAAVVLRSGSAADVAAWAAGVLARIQLPDRVHVVDALPRNALGKLDRRALQVVLKSLAGGPMP